MLGFEPTKITQKSMATPVKQPPIDMLLDRSQFNMDSVIGSTVRREPVHTPMPYIMSPPVDVPVSDFIKYMIQHDSLPQVKVYAFVLGCYYARMLYLNENYGMAYQFYQKAVDYWWTLKECVISFTNETLLKNFVLHSLYTHLHMCHCLMQMKKHEELSLVCDSIKELLTLNVCDNTATIEECNFTITVAMDFLSQNTNTAPKKTFQSFESFVLEADIQRKLSPPATQNLDAKLSTTTKKMSKNIPIFMDGQKSVKMSPAQKKRLLFSKKKNTLDSPNVSDLCIDLTSITTSSETLLSAKHTGGLLKKSASDFSVTASSSSKTTIAIKTVKRSTRKVNKENDEKAVPVPTPVKRPVLKKKQLKFSPTLSSPVEATKVLKDTVDETIKAKETPKPGRTSRKAAIKPKTVTKSANEKTARLEKETSVITIDSDSDTSVINASIEPPMTFQQLSAQRAKRYKARAAAKK